MTGMNKYTDKERRYQRLRNKMAKDLAKSKYHQRVIANKKKDAEFDDSEDD